MDTSNKHAISTIVEGVPFERPLLTIIGLCFLLMVCDSYDVAALSFAAPVLIKQWSLTPQAMGLIFSAGLFGLLVGSILFGWVGDRYGRKQAMIIGALGFSVLTAATGFARSEESLLALRFLATIGLGGAVPNAVALTSEFTPKAYRITAVGVIFAGYSIGGIAAGLSAAYVVGALGWQMMFFIGGALSLLCTCAFLLLPESLAYLASRPERRREAIMVANYVRPDLKLDSTSELIPDVPADVPRAQFSDLFRGPLMVATPLLWIVYIASAMTVFSLVSWMPVAAQSVGLSQSAAAVATALLFAGSAVGGIVAGWIADRLGILAVAGMGVLGFPAVAALGSLGNSAELLLPASFFAGFFAFGGQTCLHGVVGSLYPTNVRANGVGWAIGINKIGSIAGPYIGGLLLSHLTGQQLFLAAASPLVVVVVVALALWIVLSSSTRSSARSATSIVH